MYLEFMGGLKPIYNWGHPVTGIIDVGKKCLGSELRWDESLQGWYEQLWTASAAKTGLSLIAFRCFQHLSAMFGWGGTLTYGFVYTFLQHENCDGVSEDSLSKICRQLGHPIHMLATFTTSIAPITIFISHRFLVRFREEFAEDPGSNMFYSALK